MDKVVAMGKIKSVLIIILIILLSVGTFSACKQKYPGASMTADQVINIVYVYGVPTFPVGNSPHPSGQWGAVYQGEGEWRVQGTVAVTRRLLKRHTFEGETLQLTKPAFEDETEYYQTTWSYADDKLKLIKYQQ